MMPTNLYSNDQTMDWRQLRRHDPYYINGGDLHFLVENTLFRVHRYFFVRESFYFRDQLACPASPGRQPRGTEDSSAIVLDNVRVVDFERFLWVFYNPKYSLYDTNVEEWASILELAHKWTFPEVKALSVRELEKLQMSAVNRIYLYQTFEVDETLLLPCYTEICSRDMPISVEEGEKLGMRTAMRLAMARERARARERDGLRSPLPADFKEQQLLTLVKELFEINPLTSGTSTPSPTTQQQQLPTSTAPQRTHSQQSSQHMKNGSISMMNGSAGNGSSAPITNTNVNGASATSSGPTANGNGSVNNNRQKPVPPFSIAPPPKANGPTSAVDSPVTIKPTDVKIETQTTTAGGPPKSDDKGSKKLDEAGAPGTPTTAKGKLTSEPLSSVPSIGDDNANASDTASNAGDDTTPLSKRLAKALNKKGGNKQ